MMGADAAMAYLKTLRVEQQISQRQVAEAVQKDDRQVRRWEAGAEPSGSELIVITEFLRGSLDHVRALVLNPSATPEDGAEMARRWLSRDTIERIQSEVQQFSDEEKEAAFRVISTILGKQP